ncbi:hypothetical protein [Brachybacterium sp. UNK5269]|uniref:hypothetical protein n=1 Tax=Brachybacterium sp. UNK5269 TaxID=3408576 RepID=UPI003BAEDCE6
MAIEHVSVTVDEEHLVGVREVAARLAERGLEVESVLETLGIVTGTTNDPVALRAVEGVASVDRDRGVQLPPSDSEVQ